MKIVAYNRYLTSNSIRMTIENSLRIQQNKDHFSSLKMVYFPATKYFNA